jgi:2-polyprenyl-6-hydroxyphenyl methylase/3-demethylubiquinone-9 3-methyltransferase
MGDYYAAHLSAERLQRCYELAPPRVQQYLEAEFAFVASRLRATDAVLELGCGYGRILRGLAAKARQVVGIDTSPTSVQLGRELLRDVANCQLLQMDAAALGFADQTFDVVVCIQNGVSAFKIEPRRLLAECLRVTRPGGRVLLSSYAAKFWPHRLEWFQLQAEHGLLGEIDWPATRDGVIVCQDGFRATTFGPDEFRALAADLGVVCHIEEVDESSVFCEIAVAQGMSFDR